MLQSLLGSNDAVFTHLPLTIAPNRMRMHSYPKVGLLGDCSCVMAESTHMDACRPRTAVLKFFSNNAQRLGLKAILRKAGFAS